MNFKTTLASLCFLALTCTVALAQAPAAPGTNQITVNVLGAVGKPSRYPLPAKATVLDALAAAGDVAQNGDLHKVKLIHATASDKPDTAIINVREVLNGTSVATVLRDGDTLFIPTRLTGVAF